MVFGQAVQIDGSDDSIRIDLANLRAAIEKAVREVVRELDEER